MNIREKIDALWQKNFPDVSSPTGKTCNKCGDVAGDVRPLKYVRGEVTEKGVYFITCRVCKKHWCADECAIEDDALTGFLISRENKVRGERLIVCEKCQKDLDALSKFFL